MFLHMLKDPATIAYPCTLGKIANATLSIFRYFRNALFSHNYFWSIKLKLISYAFMKEIGVIS